MYRKLILFLIVYAVNPSFGQIIINSNNFPVGGLKINRGYSLATSTALGSPGSNQFYDFSSIIPVFHDTIKYYQASQTPWAAFHPGATIASAISGNGLTTVDYFSASSTAFRRTGQTLIGNFGGGLDTVHANYIPDDTLLSSNYTYGNIENTRAKATYINFLSTANLERTIIRSSFFDGWGSLQTPLNYYGDVLRMKGGEINYDTAFYFGTPIYTAADTQYYYKYYAKDIRHPVVVAHTDKNFNLQYLEYIFSPPVIAGCMDTMAQNYNPLANTPDGSCVYCNVAFTITSDTTICKGNTINLTVTGGNSYMWQDGSTSSTLSITPEHSSNYSVYVSNSSDCHALANVYVTVDEPVDAAFWTSHDTYYEGEVVQFVNLSTQASQYLWDFDEPPSGSSTLEYPLYTYVSSGLKNIVLIASNSCYADTSSAQITILEPSSLPNSAIDGSFSIFPNPGKEYFSISGKLNGCGIYEIIAIDLLGRTSVLASSAYHDSRLNSLVTTEKLPDGIYLIELRTAEQNIRFKWLKTK